MLPTIALRFVGRLKFFGRDYIVYSVDISVSIVSFSCVSRYYGSRVGVECISLDIDRPGVYALLGHNGAGKTTLIRLALGLLKPSQGFVKVFGHDPYSSNVRKFIGYLGEEPGLYGDLTVVENLMYFCSLRYGDENICRGYVDDVISLLELGDIAFEKVKRLSRGNIQRVAVARALLGKPKLFLLDEPFNSLDPVWRVRLREILAEMALDGCIVVFSSHVLTEVELMADYYIVLRRGRLVFYGDIDKMKRFVPLERHRRLVIRTKNVDTLASLFRAHGFEARGMRDIVEVEIGEGLLEKALQILGMYGSGIEDVKTVGITLEDLYLALEGSRYE